MTEQYYDPDELERARLRMKGEKDTLNKEEDLFTSPDKSMDYQEGQEGGVGSGRKPELQPEQTAMSNIIPNYNAFTPTPKHERLQLDPELSRMTEEAPDDIDPIFGKEEEDETTYDDMKYKKDTLDKLEPYTLGEHPKQGFGYQKGEESVTSWWGGAGNYDFRRQVLQKVNANPELQDKDYWELPENIQDDIFREYSSGYSDAEEDVSISVSGPPVGDTIPANGIDEEDEDKLLGEADFKEEDHPRDGGKFTTKGGGDTGGKSENKYSSTSDKDLIKSIKGGSKEWKDWGRNEKTEDAYAEIERRNQEIPKPKRPEGGGGKIFRDDPDAVSKMEAKVKYLEDVQDFWKKVTKFPNRDYKNHNQLGDAKYYELSNNSANLRDAKKKLEGIKSQQGRGTQLVRKPTYKGGKKRFYYSEEPPTTEVKSNEQAPEIFSHMVVSDPSSPEPFKAICDHCGYVADSVYPEMQTHLKQSHDIAVEAKANESEWSVHTLSHGVIDVTLGDKAEEVDAINAIKRMYFDEGFIEENDILSAVKIGESRATEEQINSDTYYYDYSDYWKKGSDYSRAGLALQAGITTDWSGTEWDDLPADIQAKIKDAGYVTSYETYDKMSWEFLSRDLKEKLSEGFTPTSESDWDTMNEEDRKDKLEEVSDEEIPLLTQLLDNELEEEEQGHDETEDIALIAQLIGEESHKKKAIEVGSNPNPSIDDSYRQFIEPTEAPTGKVIVDQTYGVSEPETPDGQDLTGITVGDEENKLDFTKKTPKELEKISYGNEEIIEKTPPKIEYMYYKQHPFGRQQKGFFGNEVNIEQWNSMSYDDRITTLIETYTDISIENAKQYANYNFNDLPWNIKNIVDVATEVSIDTMNKAMIWWDNKYPERQWSDMRIGERQNAILAFLRDPNTTITEGGQGSGRKPYKSEDPETKDKAHIGWKNYGIDDYLDKAEKDYLGQEGGLGSGKKDHKGWMRAIEEEHTYDFCENCSMITEQVNHKCNMCGKKVIV